MPNFGLPDLPGLAALPGLPQLADNNPFASAGDSTLGKIGGGILQGASFGLFGGKGSSSPIGPIDIITIVLGLLIILGAFLTFDSTRKVITKAAGSAAEVAAA